jgi:hypothetical protein
LRELHGSVMPLKWSKLGKIKKGVDVMIIIFCDFHQFSAKKLAFSSKINAMIQTLRNLAVFGTKNADFLPNFSGENIFIKS